MSTVLVYDIVIVGGGLSGLALSIEMARKNYKVALLEKQSYPLHRVCGEYISHEAWPYLRSLGIHPEQESLPVIQELIISDTTGKLLRHSMKNKGGIGVSRYWLDNRLVDIARYSGVDVIDQTNVDRIHATPTQYRIETNTGFTYLAKAAVACYGKRSSLDKYLNRTWFMERSDFIGVKYHIQYDYPKDQIHLYNFEDGYCGMSHIEQNKSCLCYLTTANTLKKYGSIETMEDEHLSQNPWLRKIFLQADFYWHKPLSISQISFIPKDIVTQEVPMLGDAAGLITPLCGNGMSIALQSAKMMAVHLSLFMEGKYSRTDWLTKYEREWKSTFAFRLWAGRQIQQLFGKPSRTNPAIAFLQKTPWLTSALVRATHGKPF